MAYTRVNWENFPSTNTPRNATNLNVMDAGIDDVDNRLSNAEEFIVDHTTKINNLNTGWVSSGETWTYSSVDDPTGVITISGDKTSKYSLGMRIKFTNGGNTIYGIITKISYSSPNTTLTFLHEINPSTSTALHLMANSAITSNYYSNMKAPFGFPLNSDKWSILKTSNSFSQVSNPVAGTVYQLEGISLPLPIGDWKISNEATLFVERASAGGVSFVVNLSESSNSTVNPICGLMCEGSPLTNLTIYGKNYIDSYIVNSPKTLYLTGYTPLSNINRFLLYGSRVETKVKAVCNYL